MGVTSVSLPKWKGKDTMASSEIGSYNSATLKNKKVTAYAEAVRGSYKTLRNITTDIYEGSNYDQHTWVGTRDTDTPSNVWCLNPGGFFTGVYTSFAFGIRPAIEY